MLLISTIHECDGVKRLEDWKIGKLEDWEISWKVTRLKG